LTSTFYPDTSTTIRLQFGLFDVSAYKAELIQADNGNDLPGDCADDASMSVRVLGRQQLTEGRTAFELKISMDYDAMAIGNH